MNAYFKRNAESRLRAMGMTQKSLAEKMGVSEVTVSRWLSGSSGLTVGTLERIAAALGTTSSALLSDEAKSEFIIERTDDDDDEEEKDWEETKEVRVTYELIFGLLLAAVPLGILSEVQKKNLITILKYRGEDISRKTPCKENDARRKIN